MNMVSIVVPLFNERDNVPILVERTLAAMSTVPDTRYELILVDDGSTDGTREAIDAIANGNIRGLHMAGNQGQSAALVAGMRAAAGEFILTMDGDLQNDPADFPRILELLQQFDCVCGYRSKRQDTPIRRVSSRVANAVRNAILKDGIRDSGCGVKGYRRACVTHIVPFNGAHRFIAAMLRGAGFTIVECPVAHHPRVHGQSKYGIGNRLWRGIYDMFGVAWLRRRYVPARTEGSE
jgi:dolichol-phosphate mannosyltransferase